MVIIYFYNYHNYNYFHCFSFCFLLRFYIIGCFSTYLTSASDPSRNQWWNLGVPNERLHPLLDWVRFRLFKRFFCFFIYVSCRGSQNLHNFFIIWNKMQSLGNTEVQIQGRSERDHVHEPNPYESQTFFERKLTHYLYSHRVLPSSRCVYSKLMVENGRTVLWWVDLVYEKQWYQGLCCHRKPKK